MSIQPASKTDKFRSTCHPSGKVKKTFGGQSIFADNGKTDEAVCENSNTAYGLLIEYLDIPTFLRRGVSLSG